MKELIINNANGGIINIYMEDEVANAKDLLLTKMYYARNKDTINGRNGWQTLLDMYYSCNYQGMVEYISNIKGRGQATRNVLLSCLDTIIKNK